MAKPAIQVLSELEARETWPIRKKQCRTFVPNACERRSQESDGHLIRGHYVLVRQATCHLKSNVTLSAPADNWVVIGRLGLYSSPAFASHDQCVHASDAPANLRQAVTRLGQSKQRRVVRFKRRSA
jgi:hypothetical protein